MRTALLTILAGMLLMGGAASATTEYNLLTGSEELRLEFGEAVESINSIAVATEPLQRHLSEGVHSLAALIDLVAEDPSLLNKSRFELAFARQIRVVIRDMDAVVANRDQVQWAFQDISDEVKRVALRLDHNYDRVKEKVGRKTEQMQALARQMTTLAREIERAGDRATPEMKRRFTAMHRRHQIHQRTLRGMRAVESQLKRSLGVLGKNGSLIEEGGRNLAAWFDDLNANRDSLRKLAESRMSMANLTVMMRDGGMHSVVKTFGKMRDVQSILARFNTTLDAMDGSIDTLETFDANALDLSGGVALDEGEPWKDWLAQQ